MPEDLLAVLGMTVHPAADVFPMLSDVELDDLAADIKVNGLLQPLVIGRHEGQCVLVDGRNRREACRRAEVTPRVTDMNLGLDAAYKQALATKMAGEKELERHARLKRKAPDLADRYQQKELTYEEAETLFAGREREARQKRDGIYQTFIKAIRASEAVNGTGDLEELPDLLADVDYYAEFRDQAGDVTTLVAQAECLERSANRLRAVIAALPKRPGVRRRIPDPDHGVGLPAPAATYFS